MGAINRPLRGFAAAWYSVVHVFISIIWPLLHTSSDFLEFFTRESSHCLGTHAALCDGAKDQACRRLIIGSLSYHHIIKLAQYQVEPNQPAPGLFCRCIE